MGAYVARSASPDAKMAERPAAPKSSIRPGRCDNSHTSGVGGQSEPAALEPPCFCWPRGLGQVRMPVRAVNIIAAASASRRRRPARPMQQTGRATLAASGRLVRTCRKLPSSRSSLRFGWAEEGRRYRDAQHLGAAALVKAAGMVTSRTAA
jgi:hypothetical protein